MTRCLSVPAGSLARVTAPMVDASDLAFRLMCIRGGATCTYSQMWLTSKLLDDLAYRARALVELEYEDTLLEESERKPTIVQLGGSNVQQMLQAAKLFEGKCAGIDINAGCPQKHAMEGGYGSAFLPQKDWVRLEEIVRALRAHTCLPVSVKIRLCSPVELTVALARRLQQAGAAHITLHARFPSAARRRHGAAQLEHVKALKQVLQIPVLSNGNVRCYGDVLKNLEETGADGVMVGEELLRNPYLFRNRQPDPFELTQEYLAICARFPESASLNTVQHHIKYFFEQQRLPKAWSSIVKKRIANVQSLDEIGPILTRLRPSLLTIADA